MADDAMAGRFATELAAQFARVLESMIGEAPQVEATAGPLPEADRKSPEYLWWQQPFTLAPDAVVWIGAGSEAWAGIGARVLRGAGVEEEDRDGYRSTYLEIATQSLSGFASFLSSTVGREISCDAGREAAPIETDCTGYMLRIVFPDLEVQLLAGFSRSLMDDRPGTPSPAGNVATASKSSEPAAPPASIDLLLDVELPVSISFGRAQLPLKDVLKLSTGSIVELNRSVSEPVEVIINNCVIARGEVVVVEGNFGIRIKQVISRQERLRTLN